MLIWTENRQFWRRVRPKKFIVINSNFLAQFLYYQSWWDYAQFNIGKFPQNVFFRTPYYTPIKNALNTTLPSLGLSTLSVCPKTSDLCICETKDWASNREDMVMKLM